MARAKKNNTAAPAPASGTTAKGAPASAAQDIFVDYGTTGVPIVEGVFGDRQPPELQGQPGIQRMAEMLRKEPAVWMTQNMIALTARQAKWKVNPATDKPGDREVADILESMMDDMSSTWWDSTQFALSSKAFGFSDLHIVYKRRAGRTPKIGAPSKYDDQLIGLRKLAIRRQETIVEWQPDEHGDMKFMVQEDPTSGQRFEPVAIERLLHFRGGDGRGAWEGIGWLEPAYKLYYQLEKYELIMGIGHQRAHMGLPVFEYLQTPDAQTKTAIELVARNLTVNQQGYVTYPGSVVKFRLESVSNANGGELRELVSQLRWEIMTLGLCQFFRLGSTASGSRALADPLVEQFQKSINASLDDIAIVLNRHLMQRVLQVNPTLANKVSDDPQFVPSKITSLPVDILQYLDKINTFLLSAGPEDQLWLRGLVDMPMVVVQYAEPVNPAKPKDDAAKSDDQKPPADDKKPADQTKKNTAASKDQDAKPADKAAANAKLSEPDYNTLTDHEQAIFATVSAQHIRALQHITTHTSSEEARHHA